MCGFIVRVNPMVQTLHFSQQTLFHIVSPHPGTSCMKRTHNYIHPVVIKNYYLGGAQ